MSTVPRFHSSVNYYIEYRLRSTTNCNSKQQKTTFTPTNRTTNTPHHQIIQTLKTLSNTRNLQTNKYNTYSLSSKYYYSYFMQIIIISWFLSFRVRLSRNIHHIAFHLLFIFFLISPLLTRLRLELALFVRVILVFKTNFDSRLLHTVTLWTLFSSLWFF